MQMPGNLPPVPARSTRGQRGLATWLKHLENRSNQSPDPNDPVATDDFTSLWRELRSNTFAAETANGQWPKSHSFAVTGPTGAYFSSFDPELTYRPWAGLAKLIPVRYYSPDR